MRIHEGGREEQEEEQNYMMNGEGGKRERETCSDLRNSLEA